MGVPIVITHIQKCFTKNVNAILSIVYKRFMHYILIDMFVYLRVAMEKNQRRKNDTAGNQVFATLC